MSARVDVFFSYRSPYSYLATPRLVEIAARYDVDVVIRPVLPIAVRIDDFFKNVNPLWPPYLVRDVMRIGEYTGVPISWPQPDPIVQDPETLEVAEDQPYIYRITRMGTAASEAGGGLAFTEKVSEIIWSGRVQGWHEGGHLEKAVADAGLDFDALDAASRDDADRLDAVIADNQSALETAGHWGVPTMVFEGEPFFGQDRLDLLVWTMRRAGVAERG